MGVVDRLIWTRRVGRALWRVCLVMPLVSLTSFVYAQDRSPGAPPGAPVQLVPEQLRAAKPAASALITAPITAPKPAREPKGSILRGQVIPQRLSIGRGDPLYKIPVSSRRRKIRLHSDHIARRVFRPNVLRRKGPGYFLVMPGGRVFALPVTDEKKKSIPIQTEIRLLALVNRKRMRRARRSNGRYSRRARSMSDYFSDLSLKRGDIIVTSSGLKVFRGTDAFPYKASHFVSLSQWRKQNGSGRTGSRLEALQKQIRKQR